MGGRSGLQGAPAAPLVGRVEGPGSSGWGTGAGACGLQCQWGPALAAHAHVRSARVVQPQPDAASTACSANSRLAEQGGAAPALDVFLGGLLHFSWLYRNTPPGCALQAPKEQKSKEAKAMAAAAASKGKKKKASVTQQQGVQELLHSRPAGSTCVWRAVEQHGQTTPLVHPDQRRADSSVVEQPQQQPENRRLGDRVGEGTRCAPSPAPAPVGGVAARQLQAQPAAHRRPAALRVLWCSGRRAR